jgi:hypothetical protein
MSKQKQPDLAEFSRIALEAFMRDLQAGKIVVTGSKPFCCCTCGKLHNSTREENNDGRSSAS